MSWAAIDRFGASELREALRTIEESHRRTGEIDEAERSSRLQRIRELLLATDDREVPKLRARLTRRDLVLLPDLVAAETEAVIEKRACLLAGSAQLAEIPRRSWKLVVGGGPHGGLHAVLQAYQAPLWLTEIVNNESDVPRVARWIGAKTLEAGLLGDREREPAVTVAAWMSGLPPTTSALDETSPVWPAFWRELLEGSSGTVLGAERPATLIAWAESLGEAVVDAFVVNYLSRFRSDRGWHAQVIEWAIGKRGRPTADSVVGVWRRADERDSGVIAELLSWLALRTLADFFGAIDDPNGRFDFWKKHFGHQLLEAYRLCGGEAAALRLPGVVVVEFAHHGNAAYVYPDSEIPWVRRVLAAAPADLKDRARLVHLRSGELRIIHNGAWQAHAYERMTQAMRLCGRR